MIAFVGDIHGQFHSLAGILAQIEKYPEITAIIQVGDFGFYPKFREEIAELKPTVPLYAIDGNHEDFNLFDGLTEVTEMGPNVFFVPRGMVLEIDCRTIAFMGGAGSVDKEFRKQYGRHWDGRENITPDQIANFRKNVEGKQIDIMVTHAPPQAVIQRNFDPNGLLFFGLPTTWKDVNADIIETLWTDVGQPQLICGHMHKHVVDGTVRILDINELYCL